MFSMHSLSENPLIATFQLSSAASLNWGRSQNGVLGNGLTIIIKRACANKAEKGEIAFYPIRNKKKNR